MTGIIHQGSQIAQASCLKGKKNIYVHHETITAHFKNFLTRKETSGYHAFSIIYEFREEKSRFLTY